MALLEIEIQRTLLHNYIELYGLLDERTIRVSQELDILISREQGGVYEQSSTNWEIN